MPIEQVHSFLAHPAKGVDEAPTIGGTAVGHQSGQLGSMLTATFDNAPSECNIEIVFRAADDGSQQNDCRDEFVTYAANPTLTNGRAIAERLQASSTNSAGLGLLFLMTGVVADQIRLVVSRFPADQAIIAEENQHQLSVEFLERVFMRSTHRYKSAIYESPSLDGGYWAGRAVDKQVSGRKELSDYWIRDFLVSQLRTTGPAGSKRLGQAMRKAAQATERLTVRQEIVAAVSLIKAKDGQVNSATTFLKEIGLSEAAQEAVSKQVSRADLMEDKFPFDAEEFQRHVRFRFVELDTGAMLLAEEDKFDQVFEQVVLQTDDDPGTAARRFVAEGVVVDERLRNAR